MGFDKIPSEILRQILTEFELVELYHLTRVSSLFLSIIKLDSFWSDMLKRDKSGLCYLLQGCQEQTPLNYYKKLYQVPSILKILHCHMIKFGKILVRLDREHEIRAVKLLDFVVHSFTVNPNFLRIEVHCQKLGLKDNLEDSEFKVIKYDHLMKQIQSTNLVSASRAFGLMYESIVSGNGNVIALSTSALLVPIKQRMELDADSKLPEYKFAMDMKFNYLVKLGGHQIFPDFEDL